MRRADGARFLVPFNGALLIVALTALLSINPGASGTKVGQVAASTVIAVRKVSFVDTAATAAARAAAAAAVTPVYRPSFTLADERRAQATTFLQRGESIVTGPLPAAQRLAAFRQFLPPGVSSANLEELPNLTPSDYRAVARTSEALLSQAVAWRFDADELTTTEISLLSTVGPHVPIQQRTGIGEVIATFLTPTLIPDKTATALKRRAAMASIHRVVRTIYPGEVVVRRGDMVTPTINEELQALGLLHSQHGWGALGGALLFSGVVVAMLFWYLSSFWPALTENSRLLLLIDLSLLVAVAGGRLLSTGHVLLPLFLPLAAASVFSAVLVAPEAAVALGVAMAILAGWVVANSFELTVYYLLTTTSGVLAIRQMRTLRQFILTGAYIACFGLLTLLAFGLADHAYDPTAIQDYVLAATFNGFVSASLALAGFALLAEMFGVTTTMHLLELGQPNQPLLRRVMVKAPGTYNHGLILSTMVERAADEIGANALVAKVAALYHDVGKVTNPLAFAENQLGVGNLHDDLHPEESARIIRGHVTQGVRLARQHKLPRVILDAIIEHHGTMQIAYFLHKAREQGEEDIDISLFTYPGPKPQTKETALIMLADGCETAVRAAADHTQQNILAIVNRIIADRVATGQLDESPLTLRDLERIRGAFCSVLNGLYHPRVEYPEAEVRKPVEVEPSAR